MLSRYQIVPVADPEHTRQMLARALGLLAEVRKHRTLLTRRNVRLHLDRVETLGSLRRDRGDTRRWRRRRQQGRRERRFRAHGG